MHPVARRVAEVGGLRGADLLAFLSHMAVQLRGQIVEEAATQRDQDMHYAGRQLAEWRRAIGARQHSRPLMVRIFEDRSRRPLPST